MSKYCQFCGKELKKEAKFCPNCGNKISIEKKKSKATQAPSKSPSASTKKPSPTAKTPEPVTPQPETPQPETPQPTHPIPPTQQHYQQPPTPQPTSAPMQQKKSNKGLIIGIVAAVVVIVVVLIVVMMFFGGTIMGGDESDFYGTWTTTVGIEPYTFTYEMVFNNDKTLEYGLEGLTYEVGTWNLKNNKLDLKITMVGSDLSSQAYDYEFSNGGKTLKLESNEIEVMTLTKK